MSTSGDTELSLSKRITFRHVVAVLTLVLAIYSFSSKETGNGLLSLLIAVAAVLYEFAIKPNTFIEPVTKFLRQIYQKGDGIARALMVVLALGGSALIIDRVYQISFLNLWDWLDTAVKRTALVLVVLVPSFYLASLFSKTIYRLSTVVRDDALRAYESLFYFCTTVFIVVASAIGWGFRVEAIIPSENPNGPQVWPMWPLDMLVFLAVVAGIALVWVIALFFCVVSRKREWVAKVAEAKQPAVYVET